MVHNPDDNLPAGKLPPPVLQALLALAPPVRHPVVVGAQYGEDAAVLDMGDRYLVLAMDPVTLSAEPGALAVAVNANDVAVMGAEPRWLLATILLPALSTGRQAEAVMRGLQQGCLSLGIDLIGGHTEVTPSVERPVVIACLIGEVVPEGLVTTSGAETGDRILLAGAVAVEGTGILAREYADVLLQRGISHEEVDRAAALLDEPGISVLPAVRALTEAVRPHAMHDPTEGGVLSALREMAVASRRGLHVDTAAVPLLPSCRVICEALQLDPLALLASGSLLAAVAPEDVDRACEALRRAGIAVAGIATVLQQEEGLRMLRDGREKPLPEVERDELARWVEERG